MRCVVTKSGYTQGEDFSAADGVLEDAGSLHLGDLAALGLRRS